MMATTTIPNELAERRQWVVRRDKVPYNPNRPGAKASPTDPTTWGTYQEAVDAVSKHGFDGLGFVFTADDPYVGVDLDKCRDATTGEVEPWAQRIVDELDSYTESSPSGTGVHVIVKGELTDKGNRKGGGRFEVYDRERYFTVTGDHWTGTPKTPQPRKLERVHSYALDPAVLAAREASGDKFDRLWFGDTSEYGGDDSAADLALCAMLAYHARNRDTVDRLYRRSGLMRDKWDRDDYRKRTLDKAFEGVAEDGDAVTRKPRLDEAHTVDDMIAVVCEQTGLDRDHPYVIDQVARVTNWSRDLVRLRVAPSKPWRDTALTIKQIRDNPVSRADLWMIDGVLPVGSVTMFAGKSKAGKSRLALEAARALATGDKFLGEHSVTKRVPVVFLCGDDSDTALHALFEDWADLHGVVDGVSVVLNPELDLLGATGMKELRAFLGGFPEPPLLVLDSLYNFTPTLEDNDRAPVKKVMGDLKRLAESRDGDAVAAGVLIVDHSAKVGSAEAGADAVIGSQAKGGMARSGINVEVVGRTRRESDGELVAVTKLVRWGNSGEGWSVKYQHHAPTFTWTKVNEDATTAKLCDDMAQELQDNGGRMMLKVLCDKLGKVRPASDQPTNPVRMAAYGNPDRFTVTQAGERQPLYVELVPPGAHVDIT